MSPSSTPPRHVPASGGWRDVVVLATSDGSLRRWALVCAGDGAYPRVALCHRDPALATTADVCVDFRGGSLVVEADLQGIVMPAQIVARLGRVDLDTGRPGAVALVSSVQACWRFKQREGRVLSRLASAATEQALSEMDEPQRGLRRPAR